MESFVNEDVDGMYASTGGGICGVESRSLGIMSECVLCIVQKMTLRDVWCVCDDWD